MKHRPKKSEIMIKKINRIMQIFYVFRISCFRKTKVVWLDLFKDIIIFDKNKKMYFFRCSFVKLFRKNFEMMEKQSFEKKNLSKLSFQGGISPN